MVETFGVDLSGLVLDMTNFATWIDSANERAPIAQRGHSKQKRSDLRICGLGLVVSTDGGVPLVSLAYPGNRPDVTQFATMVNELVARFGTLLPDGKGERLTLVYDAGQNSGDNYETLDHTRFTLSARCPPRIIPSSSPQQRTATKSSTSRPSRPHGLRDDQGRLRQTARLVCCHSDGLHDKQSRGFDQTLAKVRRQLTEIQSRLARATPANPRRESRPR